MAQQTWLVRHGETEWSANGRHTGNTDLPLTPRGEQAARVLAPVLGGHDFALVLASPLQRARRTAELAGLGDRLELREDLREWDYGAYEGRSTAEIRAERPGWTVWRDGVLGGETADEVGARCDRVLGEVRRVDGDVAIFAHGHLLRVLAARWLGQPAVDGRLYALSTATVSILGYERETSVLRHWNERVATRVP